MKHAVPYMAALTAARNGGAALKPRRRLFAGGTGQLASGAGGLASGAGELASIGPRVEHAAGDHPRARATPLPGRPGDERRPTLSTPMTPTARARVPGGEVAGEGATPAIETPAAFPPTAP